jgi:flagellar hook-length control protein FliK
MSLTIATQPSVPTAPGSTRGAVSDPEAAWSFGAALTAAVATQRRPGDDGAGRDDTDGRTADGSATAATLSTSTSTSDQSVPATEAASVDAQALLAAGLVAAPIVPAGLSNDAGDRSALSTAETPAGDPHVVVAAGVTAGTTTTTTPPSVEGDPSTPVPSTPAPTTAPATAAPQQAPASGVARGTAAAATTAQATTAAATPAVTPAGTASPAAAATTVAGTTPATTAVSTTTAATDPAATAPTVAAAIADPAATRSADGDTVTPAQAPVVATAAPAAATGSRAGHGTEQQASTPGDPGLPAIAPTRGGETPFVMSTTPAAAPAAATAAAPAPLAQQLARPVFSLAQAGPGEHVVTVQVVPDGLGPVTVRAHVTAHGMHVELFAASDAGREAVRQVLPDLRRDAAGTGVSTTLDLSSQNQPQDAPGRDERPAARALPGDPGLEARVTPRTQPTTHTPSIRTAGLDVLA